MKRNFAKPIFTIATLAAAAAVWYWAFRPLGFVSYLASTSATEADIIRQSWPHRIVEPEWVSATPDRIQNWHFTETTVRVSIVGLLWIIVTSGAIYSDIKGRRLQLNACGAISSSYA